METAEQYFIPCMTYPPLAFVYSFQFIIYQISEWLEASFSNSLIPFIKEFITESQHTAEFLYGINL